MAMFFNPGQISLGNGGAGPYLTPNPIMRNGSVGPVMGGTQQMNANPAQATQPAPQPGSTVGAESVRATGTGPFDQAFRQNLATYAGGLFSRPGGNLSFDPTGQNFFGNPTGAGSAPLPGTGTSLLDQALGGNPFSFTPPQQAQPATTPGSSGSTLNNWQDWLQQFRNQGRMYGLMS